MPVVRGFWLYPIKKGLGPFLLLMSTKEIFQSFKLTKLLLYLVQIRKLVLHVLDLILDAINVFYAALRIFLRQLKRCVAGSRYRKQAAMTANVGAPADDIGAEQAMDQGTSGDMMTAVSSRSMASSDLSSPSSSHSW